MNFQEKFGFKPIFGMLHLGGTVSEALEEVEIYENNGIDGVVVENYFGASLKKMADVLKGLQGSNLHIGVNVLPNEMKSAYEIATQNNCSFIQLDYISGRYSSKKGDLELDEDLYFAIRNTFPEISVFGGVWPKYYFPSKDSVLEEDLMLAKERADAVVVTGAATGSETPLNKIRDFRNTLETHPLIVGAGLHPGNFLEQMHYADGAIVGSYFKELGLDINKVEAERVAEFMTVAKDARRILQKRDVNT